jgi:DNA-binding MarR family transcriptional regulator
VSPKAEPESIDYLLAQVCKLHHSRVRVLLHDLELHRGQPHVLNALQERDGLPHSELARQLHRSPATITKMIQRMERAGFVQRRPDAEDERVSRVYLTEAGRAIQGEMMAVLHRIEQETFDGFTPEELGLLRRFFLHMRDNLARVTGELEAEVDSDE